MIVGGDEIIPFYREYDGELADTEAKYAPLWYDPAKPEFKAIKENFFFSHGRYADTTGDDWLKGEFELATGRIVGVNAEDLKKFVGRGIAGPKANDTGILASSGICVNLLPPKYEERCYDLDYPQLMFDSRGINYDSDMVESESWRSQDLIDAANQGAFSWFVEGGHSDYDALDCPGDTCGTTTVLPAHVTGLAASLKADAPFVALGGCHAGLVVSDDNSRTADDNLVWAWVDKEASAVVGSTAFVGGDMWCDFFPAGEGWFNNLFLYFTPFPWNWEPKSFGEAVRLASKDYMGWPWFGSAKKAVNQFLLYGVPWTKPKFPTAQTTAVMSLPSPTEGELGPIQGSATLQPSAYSRTIDFVVSDHDLETVGEYELIAIPGAEQVIEHLKPVLPVLRAPTCSLPPDATITGLTLASGTSGSLGVHNIPSGYIGPISVSPQHFTNETDVTGLYPEPNFGYDVNHYADRTEVNVLFYPAQHDPTTKETILWTEATLELTYETPSAIVISAFSSDKASYHYGQPINTTATVENVGTVESD